MIPQKKRPGLRLLIANISWPPETFLHRLIRGLVDKNVEVTIGSDQRPGPEPAVKWLPMPKWDGPYVLRLLRLFGSTTRGSVRAPRRTTALVRQACGAESMRDCLTQLNRLLPFAIDRWDVIYFPWNSAAVAALPVFSGLRPVVISCRGTQINIAPHTPGRETFTSQLQVTFDRSALVHCVSDRIAAEAERYGLDRRKTRVIRPAVDPQAFRPPPRLRTSHDRLRLITVGTLSWHKGVEYSLQAVAQLKQEGIPVGLDVIGAGTEHQQLVHTVHDLDLADIVRLHGHKQPDQVAQELASADVFLLSSLSEGIANAALEAMAAGLPVVTSDCGGMREAIANGVEGFVVPLRDPKAMSNAIRRLYFNPDLRDQMGRAGRDRVQRDFCLSNQIEEWVQLFESVVENHNG